jgi:hypothetical protein
MGKGDGTYVHTELSQGGDAGFGYCVMARYLTLRCTILDPRQDCSEGKRRAVLLLLLSYVITRSLRDPLLFFFWEGVGFEEDG